MPVAPFSPMEGTMVLATVLFVDEVGVPTDPTTVTFRTRAPDGTVTIIPNTNLGIGIYTADWVVDAPGVWYVQAEGAGALVVVEEDHFSVRPAFVT